MFGGRKRLLIIACTLLAAVALPTLARAENIVVRNDTPAALVVHASSVHQGKRFETSPQQLAPKTRSSPIDLPGNKLLLIYDARFPARPLLQTAVPGGGADSLLSIYPDPVLPRIAVKPVSGR